MRKMRDELRKIQTEIREKIGCHERANTAYPEEGSKIIELAQTLANTWSNADLHLKNEILRFALSNSVWKDGVLIPQFRQPFDTIADMRREYNEKRVAFTSKNDPRSVWYSQRDSNPCFHRERVAT